MGLSFPPPPQINDLRSQKTPIESLFIEATEKFRSNLKTMYSVPVCVAPHPGGLAITQPSPRRTLPHPTPVSLSRESHLPSLQNGKIHVGYKDLMENYQIVVGNLAAERGEKDPNLVLNLFQSLLDEFTRGHTKNDFELPKVGGATLSVGRAPWGMGWGPCWGKGYPRGPHRPALCSLTAKQSSEEEAKTGTRCEYECAHSGVCVCVCTRMRAHVRVSVCFPTQS